MAEPQPTLAQFAEAAGQLLAVEIPPNPSLTLSGDLGVDSLGLFELLLLIEEYLGRELEDSVLDAMVTLGDAYDLLAGDV